MNSDRKTCKVVLRSYEGTRGARIHPEGCKVRSVARRPDRIRKYNKRGVRKRKMKTNVGDDRFKVFVGKGGMPWATSKEFLWDTGAQPDLMCGYRIARAWGILVPGGSINNPTGTYPSTSASIIGASGVPIPTRQFRNFPIEIQWRGQTYGPFNVTVSVYRNAPAILGAPSIAKLRKLGLSVSFKS